MYRGHPGQVCSEKLRNPRCHDQCLHKYRSIVGLLWLGGIVDLSLLESVAEDGESVEFSVLSRLGREARYRDFNIARRLLVV